MKRVISLHFLRSRSVIDSRLIDLTSSVAQSGRERRIRDLGKPKIHWRWVYYVMLLLSALQQTHSEAQKQAMIEKINLFIDALDQFYKVKTPESLERTTAALQALVDTAKTHTWTRTIQKILLKISSMLIALTLGLLGGLIGTTAGLFSEWHVLRGAYSGFLIGASLGLKIGTYLPDNVFKNKTICKITYNLDNLRRISSELEDKHLNKASLQSNPYAQKDYDFYQNETKMNIIETFFKSENDKEGAFKNFLHTTQSYQVCAAPAIFISRNMESTLGNHALIRYRINDKIGSPIEYGARIKTPRWVNQAEPVREVSGQKLFDMLTMDRILQETHSKTLKFRLFGFEIANNDCHTYVQKILVGTGQKPSILKRFVKETDTWVGYNLVRRATEFFKINKDEDIQNISSYYPGKQPALSFFAKPKNKEVQAIDGWPVPNIEAQRPLSPSCS